MSGVSGRANGAAALPGDVVALSVHGPSGVLDLHVPVAASSLDVATEYSRQASLPSVPTLYTRLGAALPPDLSLADAGLGAGSVLVALPGGAAPPAAARRGDAARRRQRLSAGALSVLWFAVAGAAAVLAGALAATLPAGSDLRHVTIAVLIGTAVVGAAPFGPLGAQRALVAPAFAGAAVFAITWDPAPERLPTILGVSALVAGLVAAFARALEPRAEEGLRVWVVVGVVLFVVTTLAALADISGQVVWAVLLLAAMLAARLVPLVAIDVPDQLLIDLERLAVTAWSARARPTGRRGRTVVPRQAVEAVAAGGARMVTAAGVAVLVVAPVSAYLLLGEATASIDPIGARCEVGLVGAALLLAARSYRHVGARALLRTAGLGCWAILAGVLLAVAGPDLVAVITIGAIGLGLLLVLVAVALGRGWRSAWWSRRAEVAEGVCGALAFASVVVAGGLFRVLWELTG